MFNFRFKPNFDRMITIASKSPTMVLINILHAMDEAN